MDHSTKETALMLDNWDYFPRNFTGVVHYYGSYRWFLNGEKHRENGPAVIYSDGMKVWYLNGRQHREDGPAVECINGTKKWWLNGNLYSQEEWFDELTPEQKEKALFNMDNW